MNENKESLAEVLDDIANSLRVLAMVFSDKQIAHLRSRINEKKDALQSWGTDLEGSKGAKDLQQHIDLYKFKVKSYEDMMRVKKEEE